MHKPTVLRFLAIAILLAAPVASNGAIDQDSIFTGAREPASRLNVELQKVERQWQRSYIDNSPSKISNDEKLIIKCGAFIELGYFGGNTIKATGWISNTADFLSLSRADRKKLLRDVLNQLFYFLRNAIGVDPNASPNMMQKRHIDLSVIISSVVYDTKRQMTRSLPSGLGAGHAGYKDGQFVYSNPYYLELEVTPEGKAKPGDPEQFTIEKE